MFREGLHFKTQGKQGKVHAERYSCYYSADIRYAYCGVNLRNNPRVVITDSEVTCKRCAVLCSYHNGGV